MHGILAAALFLAAAQSNISVTSQVGGTGTTTTHIETTVNGNTTTVDSNQPGAIRVEKTDTTETVTSDNPVTVTHSTETATKTDIPEATPEATPSPTAVTGNKVGAFPYNYWESLFRSVWDHVKNIFRLGT